MDAYWIAKRLEQSNPYKRFEPSAFRGGFRNSSQWNNSKGNSHKTVNPENNRATNTNGGQNTTVKNEGRCFRCNEKWYQGHKQDCKMSKQVRAMISQEEEDEEEGGEQEEDP